MTSEYLLGLRKFYERYGVYPSRLWVNRDIYDEMIDSTLFKRIPGGYQLLFYGIPVLPR